MSETKQKIIEILSTIKPGVADFEAVGELVHGGTLDSLSIVMLIGELSDAFDIEIPPSEITYENFDSVDGLTAMVERLED